MDYVSVAYTRKTGPKYGFDVELIKNEDIVDKLIFDHIFSYKNKSDGFGAAFDKLGGKHNKMGKIVINSFSEYDGYHGFYLNKLTESSVCSNMKPIIIQSCSQKNIR